MTNTEWHNIVMRNKAAEICEKYLNKGDKIYVEGRLKTRKWQDEQGNDRYSTEIQCTDFTFLTPKGEGAPEMGNVSQPNPASNTAPSRQAPPITSGEEEDDDLPF